jgi:hypothetical protein
LTGTVLVGEGEGVAVAAADICGGLAVAPPEQPLSATELKTRVAFSGLVYFAFRDSMPSLN